MDDVKESWLKGVGLFVYLSVGLFMSGSVQGRKGWERYSKLYGKGERVTQMGMYRWMDNRPRNGIFGGKSLFGS